MDTFYQIINIIINGVSYGMVLFLIATGMSLTMGLMRVVNMSHGAIYMFSGYVAVNAYTAMQSAGVPLAWVIALIIGAAVGAAFGALLEIGFLRRLYKYPTYQVLLTIGMINILNNVAQWIWGGLPLSTPTPDFLSGGVTIGNTRVVYFRFFIIAVGIVMAVLLWLLQDKTKIGAMVRAGMDNREISSTLGINNRLIFTGVFVLGSLIAGFSALLGGGLTGLNTGSTSWNVLTYSIIVVVVGGAGSIQGALLGGLILGLANSFLTVYLPDFTSFSFYAILIIVLLIKPSGLLGRKTDVNKAIEADLEKTGSKGHPNPLPRVELTVNNSRRTPLMTAYRAVPWALVVLFLALCPLFFSTFNISMMSKVLIYVLFAASLDIIMGYGGMRSFGHAAFFGLGGYVLGIMAKFAGITNFWLLLLIVIVFCAAGSAIISYFTLRFSGTYFLIITMAFGQLLSAVAEKWSSVTGGSDGLNVSINPELGFVNIDWNGTSRYYFVLVVVLICFILLEIIMHSSFGRSIVGVRENEGRMRALGYNTWLTKYMACILAGVFAGIAGMLYFYVYRTTNPTLLNLTTSAMPMLMVIMGGGGTLWGPAIGAAIIILFQTYSGILFADRWMLLLGLLYVVCVLFLRGGIAPYLTRFWNWVGYKLFGTGKHKPTMPKSSGDKEVHAGKEAE